MALNGISTATSTTPVLTKILRRDLKLADAQAKRQSSTSSWYRSLNILSGTHQAYVNGAGGPTLETLSGSASPTVGHPWSTDTVSIYGAEFRTYNTLTDTAGNIASTCNEGDVIWVDFFGSNITDNPDSYIQFSGANITNQDAQPIFAPNLVDPYPFNVYSMIGPNLPPPPANGAPILINTDNLTEGNETLTVTWYLNSSTILTATSITIVDTSTTP